MSVLASTYFCPSADPYSDFERGHLVGFYPTPSLASSITTRRSLPMGFLLAIKCKTISSTKALIVAFEERGADGAAGAPGQGFGGNGGDGQDGTYGRRGSKVSIQGVVNSWDRLAR